MRLFIEILMGSTCLSIGWFLKSFWNKRNKRKQSLAFIQNQSMDIEEFIDMTLTKIIGGVQSVQDNFPSTNGATDAIICPAWIPDGGPDAGVTNHVRKIHDIEFDLAVTVENNASSQTAGKASIRVGAIFEGELESSMHSSGISTTVNRIRFKIPLRYPLMQPAAADWNVQKVSKS